MVDNFLRYENLKSDLISLSKKINLPENLYDVFSKIRAKSDIRPRDKVQEINTDIREKIKILAGKIIKLHKY